MCSSHLAVFLATGLVSQCSETRTARKKARRVWAKADLIASQGSLQAQPGYLNCTVYTLTVTATSAQVNLHAITAMAS